jgi:hypothetical protein
MLVNLSCNLRYAFVLCCIIRMLSNALLSGPRAVSNFELFILLCWRSETINSETHGPQPVLNGSRDYVLEIDIR